MVDFRTVLKNVDNDGVKKKKKGLLFAFRKYHNTKLATRSKERTTANNEIKSAQVTPTLVRESF